MGALQPWHIIVIVVVALLLFGGRKLPEAARGLGRSLRIFKSEVSAMSEDKKAGETPTGTAPVATPSPAPAATPASQIAATPVVFATPTAPVPAPTVAAPAPVAAPVTTLNGAPVDTTQAT